MSNSKLLLLQLCTVLVLLAGCAKQQFEETTTEPLCAANLGKLVAMQTAEDVLARMHFTIDKADLESGYIKTRPLPGAQFFEFWRSENVGAFNHTEANLHNIRRTVELHINRQDEKLCIDCDVKAQRLSLPEHQVSSSAMAYRMFSQSTPSIQKLKLNPDQRAAMTWIDLGGDTRLAKEILKQIEKRIGTQKTKEEGEK